MHIDQAFPSKYVKASELQNRDVAVVISRCDIEKIGDDRKLVVYFQGKQKGLVCNKTNANRIAHLYGNDTDGWIGKEITLYTDMVDYQGRMVEAVRVKPSPRRPAQNGAPKQAPPPDDDFGTSQAPRDMDDEIPF